MGGKGGAYMEFRVVDQRHRTEEELVGRSEKGRERRRSRSIRVGWRRVG